MAGFGGRREMMIDIEGIFRYKIPNRKKLTDYGFVEKQGVFRKEVPVMRKQFTVVVSIEANGAITYVVIDNAFGEEYALAKIDDAHGGFIGEVQNACEKVLVDIAKNCFDTERLKAEQTKRVIARIFQDYGAKPEFLWEKYPDYAAFRRKDNEKWFAIIMTIDKNKLGLDGHGNIEIIDLKAEPDKVQELLQAKDYYPAYHMNKKHWYTICLDGSVSDESLFSFLSESYQCAGKG